MHQIYLENNTMIELGFMLFFILGGIIWMNSMSHICRDEETFA
jgi:hypothetical protein